MSCTLNWKRLPGRPGGRTVLTVLFCAAVFWAENEHAAALFKGIEPFPFGDYMERLVNALLRDVFVLLLAGLLWFRRKRIPDRLRRYEPAVVLGVLYLVFAGFICSKMALDPFFLTTMAIRPPQRGPLFRHLLCLRHHHADGHDLFLADVDACAGHLFP